MSKKLKVLLFRPFEFGEVMDASPKEFRDIINKNKDGEELYPAKFLMSIKLTAEKNVVAFADSEGAKNNGTRHRGISGAFIVAGWENEDYVSLTDEQISFLKKRLDSMPAFKTKSRYLHRFFLEKQLVQKEFTYQRGNRLITLSTYDVVESLLSSEDMSFLKEVEAKIRTIDLINGDVNHFLEHMGNEVADKIYYGTYNKAATPCV